MNRKALGAVLPLFLLAAACGSNGSTDAAESGTFPAPGKSIELIVPSAAGAGNDILARIIGPTMGDALGSTITVVNKEGGSQVIGLSYLAEAPKDGMTIGYTNIPSILGRYLDPSKNAKFNRESFTPIGSFASNSIGIFVKGDSEFTDLESLLAAVKATPGEISAGTDSRSGDDHINLLILQQALGLEFNIVHYDSGADKVAAVVSGEVQFAIGGISSFSGQVQAGDVRALGVISSAESEFLPGVPTLNSLGYDVDDMTSRFTLSVPAGTPAATVAALEAALKKTSEDPAVQEKLKGAFTQPLFVSAADVAAEWAAREATTKPIIESLLASGS